MYLLTKSETLKTGVTVSFTSGTDTGNIIDGDRTTSAETADAVTPTVNPLGIIRDVSVSPDAVTPEVNPDGVIRSLSIDPAIPPLTVDMRGNVSEINVDTSTIPPLDLSGIGVNLPNIPPINVLVNVTPTIETPETTGQQSTTEQQSAAATTPGQTTAAIVANEGRRDKVFGTGNPTVQTSISSEELTQALAQGQRASQEGTGFFNPATALAEGLQSLVNAVLTSGVSVGGDGVSLGASGGALTDAQVEALAASLGEDLGESFRSDFVPTLLGNQPGTVQPGSADPDDETAQAPAAVARAQLATEGTLLTLATESTLASVNAFAAQIAANTNILTQLPIIESLAAQGVSTEDAQSNLNLGERQTDLLTLLQSAQSLAGPGPDLSRMGSPDAPLHIKDVDIATPRRVEVVNMPEVKIANTAKVEVTNDVNVKQVGVVQVTQSGEWVMRLASGETIPVYVQGGSVQANLSQGGISTLAELIDVENQRRDAFNTAI